MGRFDEARRLGIVRKRLANLTDRDLQHGIADERVRPDRADQSLFRYKLPGLRQQVCEHRERLGPELDGARVPPETLVDRVEGEWWEMYVRVGRHVGTARNRSFTVTL